MMLRKRKVAHSSIREDLERVVDKDTPFAISESFRMLQTNILYLPISDKCKKIAITSPVSGEGKTYISINLSITLANNSNKKILLIDMDMRVPRVKKLIQSRVLETENFSGLSEYLAGIDDKALLLPPSVIEPIQELKIQSLGNKNPRLHTDEILIALSISAVDSQIAKKALEQLPKLKGAQVHSTVILSQVDINVLKKLGIDYTSEAKYQTKKLYHAK